MNPHHTITAHPRKELRKKELPKVGGLKKKPLKM